MSAPQDGGPAFPRVESTNSLSNSGTRIVSSGGMSLRDYFAGQALAAILGHPGTGAPKDKAPDMMTEVAKLSYIAADAMLRAKGGQP